MSKFGYLVIAIFLAIIVSGCNNSNSTLSSEAGATVWTPTQSINPYPIEQTSAPVQDDAYPGPAGGSEPTIESTTEYYVTHLVVPTPNSGKAVVTGQLLIGDEGSQPYLATLYLTPALPPNTPGDPPIISFSEQNDPLAIQDKDTGKFLFNDLDQGQYVLILWTTLGGNPLIDRNGNTITFSVDVGDIKDLGIISMH